MIFQPLRLSDIELVRPFFALVGTRTSDYTVGEMVMWRDFTRMEYAVEDGVFFSRIYAPGGELFYHVPLAEDLPAAIRHLLASEGRGIQFYTVPESLLPVFRAAAGEIRVSEQEAFADYLYRAEDLQSLAGKKYAGQRNQISQFLRGAERWSFEKLTESNLGGVREFFQTVYLPTAADNAYENEENRKVFELLDHYAQYGLDGAFLTVDGAIRGFSIHEVIGDTLFTHIEKADRHCKGAYQMLVQQGAILFAVDGVAYINREEDMGDPGLRASKQSYHPAQLLRKYIVAIP